jgi:hypothetical protein
MGTRICQGGDIRSAEGPTEGGGWREEGLQQHGCKHTQPHRYVHTWRSSIGIQMTQQQLHLRPPLASLHIAGLLSFLYMHPSPQTHKCTPPPLPRSPLYRLRPHLLSGQQEHGRMHQRPHRCPSFIRKQRQQPTPHKPFPRGLGSSYRSAGGSCSCSRGRVWGVVLPSPG